MRPFTQKHGPELLDELSIERLKPLIEMKINQLISILDMLDGDLDKEPDDEDCCTAHDDCGSRRIAIEYCADPYLPGDPDDAEETEIEELMRIANLWTDGIDQRLLSGSFADESRDGNLETDASMRLTHLAGIQRLR